MRALLQKQHWEKKKSEQLNKDHFNPHPPNPHKKSKFPKFIMHTQYQQVSMEHTTASNEVSKVFYVLFYICFCFQVTNCNCCAFLSIRLCVYGWRLNYIGSPNTSRYKSVWSSFTFFMAFSNYLDIFIVSLWWNCPALFPQDTKTCFYNICWPLTPSHHPDVLHPPTIQPLSITFA